MRIAIEMRGFVVVSQRRTIRGSIDRGGEGVKVSPSLSPSLAGSTCGLESEVAIVVVGGGGKGRNRCKRNCERTTCNNGRTIGGRARARARVRVKGNGRGGAAAVSVGRSIGRGRGNMGKEGRRTRHDPLLNESASSSSSGQDSVVPGWGESLNQYFHRVAKVRGFEGSHVPRTV